jgi:hypothetical protein
LPVIRPVCQHAFMSSPDAVGAPVFILTTYRSGSTLLRFLIDSHPEIACPPESRVAAACGHLALTWSSLERAGSGRKSAPDDPIEISDRAAAAIRAALDEPMQSYLRRRGKSRWCDKSFDSHEFAELAARVWPQAKFVILTRHYLDVIDSVIALNPWSLAKLSLEAYAARHPGNSVAAIADYWLTCTEANLRFAASHQDRCYRLRYEDLVASPEERLAAMFAFLGASPAPGISEACFRTPHELEGPGDEKIWLTSRIRRDLVGRGKRVPVGLLPPTLAARLHAARSELDYPASAPESPAAKASGDEAAAAVAALVERMRAQADDAGQIATRWPAVAGLSVAVIVDDAAGPREAFRWTFAGGGSGGTGGTGERPHAPQAPAEPGPARLTGTAQTWLALLDGRSDLVTEIASGRLRLTGQEGARRPPRDLMHATAALLGLASLIPVLQTDGRRD